MRPPEVKRFLPQIAAILEATDLRIGGDELVQLLGPVLAVLEALDDLLGLIRQGGDHFSPLVPARTPCRLRQPVEHAPASGYFIRGTRHTGNVYQILQRYGNPSSCESCH